MTIDYLRQSREIELFRQSTDSFANWFLAAVAAAPDEVCPPEERQFLSRWIQERRIRWIIKRGRSTTRRGGNDGWRSQRLGFSFAVPTGVVSRLRIARSRRSEGASCNRNGSWIIRRSIAQARWCAPHK
jgi:hypothetical protein